MSATSSITYMVIGLAILIKISIWCCIIYKRQERRRQLLQAQQIVASVNVPNNGQPPLIYPNQAYPPPPPFGVDNPGMMIGQTPPAYNEIYTNEPKLPSYDEVVSDPNKYLDGPKANSSTSAQP